MEEVWLKSVGWHTKTYFGTKRYRYGAYGIFGCHFRFYLLQGGCFAVGIWLDIIFIQFVICYLRMLISHT